jgi:CheY-like chemotaxis protein
MNTPACVNVLIVDDHPDTARSMAVLLELRGHRALCATDPREALAMVRDFEPDVAILDIALPHMDGYELAMHLRVNGAQCRLIIVSGSAERDAKRCSRAGVERFLPKPVDIDLLCAAVEGRAEGISTAHAAST